MRQIVALLFVLSFLASCTGQPGPVTPTAVPGGVVPTPVAVTPGGSGEQAVISFAAWDFERAIYEPLAAKFNAENPGIKVVIVPLDDLVNGGKSDTPESQLGMLRRVVSGADTVSSAFLVPEAYGTPLLLDLKPLLEADASFQRDDFLPGALERVTAKGGIWMLPRTFDVQLFSYNKDLFAANSIAEPKPDWTWKDVYALAEQLAKKNGNRVETYGVFDPSSGFLALSNLLEPQGINLFTTPSRELKLDRPEIVDAFNQVRELAANGVLYVPNYDEKGGGSDPMQLIKEGRLAIWPTNYFGPMSEGEAGAPTVNVGQAPMPAGNPYFSGGWIDGLMISGGTAYPNEAWKWIEFLSRQPTDQPGGPRPLDTAGPSGLPGRIPARKSVAEQTGFWKNIDKTTVTAYEQSVAQGTPPVSSNQDYLGVGVLQETFYRAFGEKNADTEKLLREAQQRLEEQLATVGITPTPLPDLSPVIVSPPDTQEAPAGVTPVSFAGFGYSGTDMRRLAKQFNQEHPELFITIKTTDNYTGTYELAAIAQNSDCFSWFQRPMSQADISALADLQPLFDADAAFPQSDYPLALLEPYRRNGGLFGMPTTFSIRALSYNQTAFSAAGIQPPSFTWQPNDFLAAAQALTSGEGNNKQYGYVSWSRETDMIFFINQYGGQLTTGSGKELRANFSDPNVLAALQWYIDLDVVHKVTPPISFSYRRDQEVPPDMSYELIYNGRAGMWFDQGMSFGSPGKEGDEGPAFEIKVAPLPVGKTGLSSGDFSGPALYIGAKAANPQACWEWMKFLSGDVERLATQGGIPARISVANSEAYAASAQPEMLELYKAYGEALKKPGRVGTDINDIYSSGMDMYWLYKAIDEARTGKVALAKGLADAQTKTNAFMECVAKGGTPADCALQADPEYKGYNTGDPMPIEPAAPAG